MSTENEQHLSGLSSFSRRASTNFTSKDMVKAPLILFYKTARGRRAYSRAL